MRALMKGMTDAAFERQFGTEEQCFAALLAARKAAGMACPACGNTRIYVSGRRIGCTVCNRRWSLTAGTAMASTKLPLTTWFRAMHAMTSTKQSISAVELGRRLGLSYPTAWYLEKRLHHAMTEREARYVLGGPDDDCGAAPVVEADDVYLGGERNKGSGPAGKTPVIAAAERHGSGRMGHIAMKVVSSFSCSAVKAFAENASPPRRMFTPTDCAHSMQWPKAAAATVSPSPAANVPRASGARRSSWSTPRSPTSAPPSRRRTRRFRPSMPTIILVHSAGPQTAGAK
jgi:transposase-like protein